MKRTVYVYHYRNDQDGGRVGYLSLAYLTHQGPHCCAHEVEGSTRAKLQAAAIREHRERCNNRLTQSYPTLADRKTALKALLGYDNLPWPTNRTTLEALNRIADAIRAAREDERTACWRIAADKFNECGLLVVQDVFAAIAARGVTEGM